MTSAIASSSNSSSIVSSERYDVFLSFRGEDTRRNFTSHLYEALKQKKVKTFRDDDELKKGDEISPALIKAIENSLVSVVIFSENYASSKWCLNELCKIMDCKKEQGQVVIPVFYNIDPSHVRKHTWSYEQAFAKHEGEPKFNTWKAALSEAANLAGWDSQTYRTESQFIKEIVGDVLQKLTPKYPNQLKGLVGIENHYIEIESLLKMGSSEVRILGIWGMGGIGKTTLATALYDKFSNEFEGGCFLADVREELDKFGFKALYNKLYSELLENDNYCFDIPFLVPHFVKSRLGRKKVLIVLDDVATSEQLENLIDCDSLGPGSRVIVTTRNKQIFTHLDGIFEVKQLSFHHSLRLFCFNAFREKHPKLGYEDLSRKAIVYCKGVPLALKVLGASLRSRSKEAWESELRKLQKIPNMEIHKVLKLSYDSLDRCEKDIFLDIACFFKGEKRGWVTSLLEACDFAAASGIETLLDRALISVSSFVEIEMHDLIQQMGWEIVDQESIKDPGRRSRLWRAEEVCNVLKYNKGTDVVEGITLDLRKLDGDIYLSSDSFAKMTNMRLLQICNHSYNQKRYHVFLPNGLESLSDKLRYLRWDDFCLESLPPNFCAENLVEFDMVRSKLKRLWDGVQNLVNLKRIILSGSRDLIEIPDLSKADNLELVYLMNCESLRELHPSLLSRPKLEMLFLANCKGIESLFGCKNLECKNMLSDDSGTGMGYITKSNLSESMQQNASNLWSSQALPHNIGSSLSLKEFPPSLERLDACNCTSLDTEFTQKLVLQHMIQNRIPYSRQHPLQIKKDARKSSYTVLIGECFLFPGDHLIEECMFQTRESSITIPYLPQSDLCGFIYCIILSKGDIGPMVLYCICEHVPFGSSSHVTHHANLISDHVIFWYHDVSKFNRTRVDKRVWNLLNFTRGAYDHFSNISFKFDVNRNAENKREWIKGCGVFPVYASESGLKLVGNNSTMEIFEPEFITQTIDNESQLKANGVGGFNNENEDDQEQLLPASKRRRTTPETIIFP
ncbi:TMV resistance protein N-like [Abrus precatorius]|uniref:TMV resistance protein N-like n=1 Tax=Abrus precatorius TaxID=3816 RepID=A0A8B8KRY2_ABRPR|nr:TMV resistance protein N-like [Abrus precatorius]